MATIYNEIIKKNFKMGCDKEPDYNVIPDDMINPDGTKNYAYVTLVMLGDLYISAAIVLAQSIRNLNSKSDLVVLVTPDVSEEGKNILRIFFDKVKDVDYIVVPNWRTKKQTHRKYLELVFTKFHLFNLTEYKKVLLIDADALIFKYPDHLFTLDTPAGTYLETKELIIKYDDKGNYILPEDGKIKWYEIYCDCCPHGHLIPKHMTDSILKNFSNSGIGGGLMLLKPDKNELDRIIKDVSQGKMKYLLENKLIWPEQQYLTLRYSGKWHMIDPKFFGLQGYPHYSVLYGTQFGGDKPFILNSKIDINIRIEFLDFILWHRLYAELLKKYPDLKDSIVLKESNAMHKYFNNKLKRNIVNNNIELEQVINNIVLKYNVNKNKINHKLIDYYFLDEDLIYRPIYYKDLLFNGIKDYDYMEPIKKLSEYFKGINDNYYTRIYQKNKSIILDNLNKPLNEYNYNVNLFDLDNIMFNYIKCKPNVFIITVWTLGINIFDDIITFLKTKGNVYYYKIIYLSKNAIRNLMFWFYDDFRISSKLYFIEKKLLYIGIQEYNNKIGFIYFDNINDLQVSGKKSVFKTELRNLMLDKLNLNKEEFRGNDIIHINDHFYQTIEYSQIILNKNSLGLLEYQDVRIYKNELMKSTNLKVQTLRKWIYENLTPLEMMRVIILGSLILYSYGIRNCKDLDGYLIDNNNSIDDKKNNKIVDKELEKLIYDNLYNKKTKLYFVDIGLINSTHWKESWTEKNNQIFKFFEQYKLNHEEIVLNPEYHLYFNGLKIYNIEFELIRKVLRHMAKDYADFIIMYFKFRNLLSNYVYLNKNNKLEFRPDLNVKVDKLDDNTLNEIYNIIKTKYNINNVITKNIISDLF